VVLGVKIHFLIAWGHRPSSADATVETLVVVPSPRIEPEEGGTVFPCGTMLSCSPRVELAPQSIYFPPT